MSEDVVHNPVSREVNNGYYNEASSNTILSQGTFSNIHAMFAHTH
jgi:hypothetical protein